MTSTCNLDLEDLLHAYLVVSLEMVMGSKTNNLQTHLLNTYQPNKAEFFTMNEKCLKACLNWELVTMAREFSLDHSKLNKGQNVEFFTAYPKAAQFIPKRLRKARRWRYRKSRTSRPSTRTRNRSRTSCP